VLSSLTVAILDLVVVLGPRDDEAACRRPGSALQIDPLERPQLCARRLQSPRAEVHIGEPAPQSSASSALKDSATASSVRNT